MLTCNFECQPHTCLGWALFVISEYYEIVIIGLELQYCFDTDTKTSYIKMHPKTKELPKL